MGRVRGKVEVRRIENSVSRQVTFSKRWRGLAKKARELAVLCDADVALLVFSDKGRLHDFAANGSMERILDRYERHLLCEGGGYEMENHPEEMQGNMSYDHIKLRSRIEAPQKSQRNLMGEQLDSLTFRELQQLEHQIERALRNIRSRKERFLLEQNSLLENVNLLITPLEQYKAALDTSLHAKNSAPCSTAAEAALPNLNICAGDSDEPGPPAPPPGAVAGLPWWMLRPPAVG
ncbi:MADS-box transcription factor 20 [Dichanthelium oligosanthes]|uniref:MADS-box transcription factor 20 n=1 Tax=Dichanthelium oligosanthes TaxID=888268 RepID=A0A1E5VHM7_9POAL|nr:MADS-box transcription factor 20 [Dichanthelium oligosanthes]